MTLLQKNAALTVVAAASSGESYDGPAAAGAEKWAGTVDAYVLEKRRPFTGVEGRDVGVERSLIVANEDLAAVDFSVGDFVTFTRTGESQETAKIQDVARSSVDDPDIPAELQTTRLVLAPL